jgi:hypothetical protein
MIEVWQDGRLSNTRRETQALARGYALATQPEERERYAD